MVDRLEQKIVEIINGLAEDDDVLEEVKNALNFKNIIGEEGADSEIVIAIRKLLCQVINKLEDDEETQTEVYGAIDFGHELSEALENDEVRSALNQLVKKCIENFNAEDDDAIQKVWEAISEGDTISEIIKDDEVHEEIRKVIKKIVQEHIATWSSDNYDLGDDVEVTTEDVKSVIESDEEVKAAKRDKLQELILEDIAMWDENSDDVMEVIRQEIVPISDDVKKVIDADPQIRSVVREKCQELVRSHIENLNFDERGDFSRALEVIKRNLPFEQIFSEVLKGDTTINEKIRKKAEDLVLGAVTKIIDEKTTGSDYFIESMLLKSASFKQAVEDAISQMSWSGKIAKMVEKAVEKKISDDPNFLKDIIRKTGG